MGRFGGGKKKPAGGRQGGRGKAGKKPAKKKNKRLPPDQPQWRKKGKPADEDAEEGGLGTAPAQVQVKKQPKRPGFNSLLEAFGVEEQASSEGDQSDDMDNEHEDEEEEEEEAEAGVEGKEALESVVPHVEQGDAEGTREGEASDEVHSDNDDDGDKEALVEDNPNGHDLFDHFWDDPPAPAVPAWSGLSAQQLKTQLAFDADRQRFALPALERCESRRRDVTAVQALLQAAASTSWSTFSFYPGVRKNFEEWLRKAGVSPGLPESALFAFMHSYLDVSFPEQNHTNARATRALCALHVVDHVLKSRRKVRENSAMLQQQDQSLAAGEAALAQFGDQGFTRPTVLILCPFRSVAREIVELILAFCPHTKQVVGRKKFDDQFCEVVGQEFRGKPAEWVHLFAGNNDDCFSLGLSFRAKSVKLYSPFVNSDVLICSPLGLRRITGVEGEKKRDFDFLSSIEISWIDRADVLRMQNWEHLVEVMQLVNTLPLGREGIDISRLRPVFADGRGRCFRQTLVTSAGQALDIEAIFSIGGGGSAASDEANSLTKKFSSRRKRRTAEKGLSDDEEDDEDGELDLQLPGVLSAGDSADRNRNCRGFVLLADLPQGDPLQQAVVLGISRQFFLHVPCSSLQEQSQRLLETFESKYWKPLGSSLERLLVVTTSYFNFLQLRRFFRKEGTAFCSAFEYSKKKDLVDARKRFNAGEKRLLLVTERFLWYHRDKFRGADYVLFYGTPETSSIYDELLSNVRMPSQCNSMCLFTKFDGFALERIVGHERACKMLTSSPGKVFLYS